MPTVLTVLTPAPVLFVVLFLFFSPVKGIVLPHGDTEALDVEVGSDAPVVMLIFDEFPSISMLDARRAPRRRALPELRAPGAAFDMVSERDDGRGLHRPRGALDPHRRRSRPSTCSRRPSALPENVFTLLGGTYELDVHEDTTRLCPAELCAEDTAESFPERMESLVSDLSVVSAHVLLPDAYRAASRRWTRPSATSRPGTSTRRASSRRS